MTAVAWRLEEALSPSSSSNVLLRGYSPPSHLNTALIAVVIGPRPQMLSA
jgi:hypothetical protein